MSICSYKYSLSVFLFQIYLSWSFFRATCFYLQVVCTIFSPKSTENKTRLFYFVYKKRKYIFPSLQKINTLKSDNAFCSIDLVFKTLITILFIIFKFSWTGKFSIKTPTLPLLIYSSLYLKLNLIIFAIFDLSGNLLHGFSLLITTC